MIVGRDDAPLRHPKRALAEAIVVAIDLPARELPLETDRKPMRQRALAKILLEQKGLTRVELPERTDDLVQFGLHLSLHLAAEQYIHHCERGETIHGRKERLDCFVASLPCANASRLSQAMTISGFRFAAVLR